MSILRLLQQLGRRLNRGDTTTSQRELPTLDEPATRPPQVPKKFEKEYIQKGIPVKKGERINPSDSAVKNLAIQNPLTSGNKNADFGSSLFDYISLSEFKNIPRDPQMWAKALYSTKARSNFKNPNLNEVRQTVSLDEISDAGIANFDKDGNLIGGFLKHADELNMKVDRDSLLKIVQRGPGDNLKITEFTAPVRLASQVDDLSKTVKMMIDDADANIKRYMPAKLSNYDRAYNKRLPTLRADLDELQIFNKGPHDEGSLRELGKKIEKISTNVQSLKLYDNDLAGQNVVNNPRAVELLQNQTQKILTQLAKSMKTAPRYSSYSEYILPGGEEYGEAVISSALPKTMIPGKKFFSTSHYGDIHNPVVFFRYSIRSLKDNPKNKVLTIEEIQNDIAKTNLKKSNVMQSLMEGKTYQDLNTQANPYTVDAMLDIERNIINQNMADMETLLRKPIPRTPEDIDLLDKLKARKDALETSTLLDKKEELLKNDFTYSPFQRPEEYANLAVKHAVKIASKRGDVTHVVVNPADGHHGARDSKEFLYKFYGVSNGKVAKPTKKVETKALFKTQQKLAKEFLKEIEKNPIDQTGYTVLEKKQMLGSIAKAKKLLKMKKPGTQARTQTRPRFLTSNTTILDPNESSVMKKAFDSFKNQYGLTPEDIGTFKIAKSDPTKLFKIPKTLSAQAGEGASDLKEAHQAAFPTQEAADAYAKGQSKVVTESSKDLYYEAYGIRITPEMKQKPFKTYKKEGGLVVNSNKW